MAKVRRYASSRSSSDCATSAGDRDRERRDKRLRGASRPSPERGGEVGGGGEDLSGSAVLSEPVRREQQPRVLYECGTQSRLAHWQAGEGQRVGAAPLIGALSQTGQRSRTVPPSWPWATATMSAASRVQTT